MQIWALITQMRYAYTSMKHHRKDATFGITHSKTKPSQSERHARQLPSGHLLCQSNPLESDQNETIKSWRWYDIDTRFLEWNEEIDVIEHRGQHTRDSNLTDSKDVYFNSREELPQAQVDSMVNPECPEKLPTSQETSHKQQASFTRFPLQTRHAFKNFHTELLHKNLPELMNG